MSHVLHGRPQHTLSGLSLTVKVLLVAALLTAALGARLLSDDSNATSAAPVAAPAFVSHPDEGSATIRPVAGYPARPDEGAAQTPATAPYIARPDEGAAPIH